MTNPKKVSELRPHDLTISELRAERVRLQDMVSAGTARYVDASRLHHVLQCIQHIESAQAESAAAT
jgi:hypothetical protein